MHGTITQYHDPQEINNTVITIYRMIPPLKTMFLTFVTILVFTFAASVQTINGSSNTSTGISVSNTTLPDIDHGYENGNEDTNTNTQTQKCQMPPCPPGEVCIQVCPESVP